jgi:chromosomal replication initiation ATPase DnaA
MGELDPRQTFDSFVVGPANRLASSAARRAAESPGRGYNPLFIYSAAGMGKTHILAAIAHEATRGKERRVLYLAADSYLEELAEALRTGRQDVLRDRYRAVDFLLVDDVHFLAGQPQAQEMLLGTLDALTSTRKQVVLASDRPPAEITRLDSRLLSRFSGGLIVDLALPEYETRLAIVRRKLDGLGRTLQPGVAEALARQPSRSVRELGGALNRVLAEQDREGLPVTAGDVAALMGDGRSEPSDDFGSFLREIQGDLAQAVEKEEPWKGTIKQAAGAAEFEGFSAARLRALLDRADYPADWEKVLGDFRADVARLREIGAELQRLGNPWPDTTRTLIRDPDRLADAEALLASVRERQRPFPTLKNGPTLEHLDGQVLQLALRAAGQLISEERPRYNPLFFWGDPSDAARALVAATARTHRRAVPGARTAVTSVAQLSEDFIRSLSAGVVGAWRERWWTVDVLLVHGIEELAETERVQDEFFHLFEALKRRGARIMVASDRPPSAIVGIDERLRSRFEGGLVLQVTSTALPSGAAEIVLDDAHERREWDEPAHVSAVDKAPGPLPAVAPREAAPAGAVAAPSTAATSAAAAPAAARAGVATAEAAAERWLPTQENVVWSWPRLDERLVEELE